MSSTRRRGRGPVQARRRPKPGPRAQTIAPWSHWAQGRSRQGSSPGEVDSLPSPEWVQAASASANAATSTQRGSKLQTMQVLPQHRIHGVTGGESLELHAHRHQHREGGDEESAPSRSRGPASGTRRGRRASRKIRRRLAAHVNRSSVSVDLSFPGRFGDVAPRCLADPGRVVSRRGSARRPTGASPCPSGATPSRLEGSPSPTGRGVWGEGSEYPTSPCTSSHSDSSTDSVCRRTS